MCGFFGAGVMVRESVLKMSGIAFLEIASIGSFILFVVEAI